MGLFSEVLVLYLLPARFASYYFELARRVFFILPIELFIELFCCFDEPLKLCNGPSITLYAVKFLTFLMFLMFLTFYVTGLYNSSLS